MANKRKESINPHPASARSRCARYWTSVRGGTRACRWTIDCSRIGLARSPIEYYIAGNDAQGQKVYFHRIIVEEPADTSKHTFTVKCVITEVLLKPGLPIATNHTTVRRSVFPAGFQEPE